MSIEPVNSLTPSAAGLPAAQTAAETPRARASRATLAARQAGDAARQIGQEIAAGDRDADGRMPWKQQSTKGPAISGDQAPDESISDHQHAGRGGRLDLMG